MSACDIINLYSEVNVKAIEQAKKEHRKINDNFKKITEILLEIKDIMKNMNCKL